MKRNKSNRTQRSTQSRNWGLVALASIQIVCSVVVTIVSTLNVGAMGWLALLFIGGAFVSLVICIIAIKKNDATWLMLGLLNPFN